ncbi:Plasmodium exported protein, unknown function [Plasmodium vivax]|uniref:Uncharacterized protein n=1 Tax=Plasmodium vivax TaxID=5855 RepID=A0A564ZU58_PLAVI|nr:Plasmodium exported protein, unknown function [Plasmodium vivax]
MELLCSYKKMDKVPFDKSLENIYKQDNILDIKFNRLLAKHDIKRELEYTRLREKLPDISSYKSERDVYGNQSAYSGVKSKAPNNIDIYMKNYKKRYMRKKGLSKLDCYCENKVFDKFNHICDIGKKMQYNEKRANKFFLKKYGIHIIIFALSPALGLIFPILFGFRDNKGIFGLCPGGNGSGSHFENNNVHKTTVDGGTCHRKWLYDIKDTLEYIGDASYIFSFIMITIFLLVIFYILIKVIKYEKIKAGKGKMNMKEYCRFCKDIF